MLVGTTATPTMRIFASLSGWNAFKIGLSLSKLLWNKVVRWNVRGVFQIEFWLLSASFGFKNERISEEEKEEKASDKSTIDL